MDSRNHFAEIKKDLLKALRKKRSQNQLSQRMSFNFNQVYRWESDHTRMLWGDFVDFCHACRVDVRSATRAALGFQDDPRRADLLIRHLLGSAKISVIARESGVSRFVFSSWLKRKSEPNLEHIFLILERRNLILRFFEQLTDVEQLPTLREKIRKKNKALRLFYSHPMASILLISLELREYQRLPHHSNEVLMARTGMEEAEVQSLIIEMEHLDLIRRVDGKYVRSDSSFHTAGDFSGERRLRHYWIQRGVAQDQSRTSEHDGAKFGFIVLPVDESKRRQIFDAYLEFTRTLYRVANTQSLNGDRMLIGNFQLFEL